MRTARSPLCRGDSPPLVNTRWGFASLAAGLLIAARHTAMPEITLDAAAGLAGALATEVFLSLHFGKVQRDRRLDR